MAYTVTAADLEPLLLGGTFFGSGGGGTVTSARHLVSYFRQGSPYYQKHSFEVVSIEEVTEGETVMVAYMGAPEAINSTCFPVGPVKAAERVQQALAKEGRQLRYVVSPESGALGFIVAGLVAAKLGLKVIDADGAGRAVPSLPMLTYAAAEISPRPTFLVSQDGLEVELNVTPRADKDGGRFHQQDVSTIVEQMLRPILAEQDFGQFGGLAMWVMKPEQLAAALPIRGTLTRALKFGRALQAGQLHSAEAVIDHLETHCGISAKRVAEPGEIISVDLDTAGGFDVGRVRLKSARTDYTIVYQNESLLVWDSEQAHPVTIAPDSISYFIEGDKQAVYSNGDLVSSDGRINPNIKGRTVSLLAWEADAALSQPNGLILDSFAELLAKMGYLGPYMPLSTLDQITKGMKA